MTVDMSAVRLAAAVRARRISAREATLAALDRVARRDRALNGFTLVRGDAALSEGAALDARIAAGADPGPLAGVAFSAKNLFDVAGVTTVAGSRIHADRPPATRGAAAVAALRRAGAILVGTTNMDEYAYGFSTENAHYGPTRNPHDPGRIAGGSSGGSAAVVAAGLVPLALGTDTNGSIRVPAALCGVFGLKPTFGRVSRTGVFPLRQPSITSGRSRARSPTSRLPSTRSRGRTRATRSVRSARPSPVSPSWAWAPPACASRWRAMTPPPRWTSRAPWRPGSRRRSG